MTFELRSKETLNDYRYMPDPDLKNVFVSDALVEELKDELPELPDAKILRFRTQYQLSPIQARILVETPATDSLFETVLTTAYTHPSKQITYPKSPRIPTSDASLIINTIFGELSSRDISLEKCINENMLTSKQIACFPFGRPTRKTNSDAPN